MGNNHPRETGRRRRRARAAFSLPELMIALVILGLGLLIIAAALPAGLRYNEQTANQANGAAAAAYAMEMIEARVRLSQRADHDLLFRPRALDSLIDTDYDGITNNDPEDFIDADAVGGPDDFGFHRSWEPRIKVRPAIAFNVDVTPGATPPAKLPDDNPSAVIKLWLQQQGHDPDDTREASQILDGWQRSLFGPGSRVYPPVLPDDPYTVSDFVVNNGLANDYANMPEQPSELRRAAESRLAWTMFYRRVRYLAADPGPGGVYGDGGETGLGADRQLGGFGADRDVIADPYLYEVIVLVARRPTAEHVFLAQNPNVSPLSAPMPVLLSDRPARMAPVPWLVTFKSVRTLNAGPGVEYQDTDERALNIGVAEPATLIFTCSPQVSKLLPRGAIFIPAVNDDWPGVLNGAGASRPARRAGFVPHSPSALPIYTVKERPDDETVIVENNGFYPWLETGLDAESWPVWVIPPVARLDPTRPSNDPWEFERSSPVVAVERRFVRFREIP